MGTLPLPVQSVGAWTDIQGLTSLAAAAGRNSTAALPAAARQFEAVFVQMMIKSMRQASFGGGILDSPQADAWRDMFDNQIALSLANDGKGLGIATMLERQLGGHAEASGTAGSGTTRVGPAASTSPSTAANASGTTPTGTSAEAGGTPGDGDTATATPDSMFDRVLNFARTTGQSALHAVQQTVFSGPDDFVQKLAPYAQAVASKLGVSIRAVLAQAALETGWGRHMPRQPNGSSSNNLFGIKTGQNWEGRSVNVPTLEYKDGVAVRGNASFRAYPGPLQAFADYAKTLISNPRYANALGQGDNIAGFAEALHHAGYATDPAYASKLVSIAHSSTMNDALATLKNLSPPPMTEI